MDLDIKDLKAKQRELAKATKSLDQLIAKVEGKPNETERYEKHRQNMAERKRVEYQAARDIGELPAVADPARRERALDDLRFFCTSYFADVFYLPWSQDHERVIDRIESCVNDGGYFALAMPRGSGKSALSRAAVMWAAFRGSHLYSKLLGSNDLAATGAIEKIVSSLKSNKILADDFPEICYPITKLEGVNQKRMLYKGKPIRLELSSHRIILPDIEESPACEAVIESTGLLAGFRGASYQRADGRTVRPTFVVPDDPQTDESASSPSLTAKRLKILTGAMLGLVGPGKSLSVIMPCTVIKSGDLSDQLLDRENYPQWRGEKIKMLPEMPEDLDLWEDYLSYRDECLISGRMDLINERYNEEREQLEAGAVVSWDERFNSNEVSALQHAMHLRRDLGELAFEAEYNNSPIDENSTSIYLTAAEISQKVNHLKRGEVPDSVEKITMFIDIQQRLLFWMIVGWESGFTGYVLDYGTNPDQKTVDFTAQNARYTLQGIHGGGIEGAITSGLTELIDDKLSHPFLKTDGTEAWVDRCLIDRNWKTKTIDDYCRSCDYPQVVVPARGRGITAAETPISDFKKKPGEIKREGVEWIQPKPLPGGIRRIDFDVNWFKSFVQARLATQIGDFGCLSLFGPRKKRHDFLSAHLTAEYYTKTNGKKRTVEVWKMRPGRSENHWLDCLVGCAVGASMEGIELIESTRARQKTPKRKRKVRYG